MPQFEVEGLDRLIAQLDKLGRFEEVAPKMLEEAIPVLQEEVVKESSNHIDSGDMASSIKKSGMMTSKDGSYYMCVRPTGKDRKGVRNMEKMAWLEYGVKGRAATPVLSAAVINAELKVIQKMQEVFNREMKL